MAERETAPLPMKRTIGLERDRLIPNQEVSFDLTDKGSSLTFALGGGTVSQGHRFEIVNQGGRLKLRNLDLPETSEFYGALLPKEPAVVYLSRGEDNRLHYYLVPGQKEIIEGKEFPVAIYKIGRTLGRRNFGDLESLGKGADGSIKAHLKIIKGKDGANEITLEDLGSTYGTWINRERRDRGRFVSIPGIKKAVPLPGEQREEETQPQPKATDRSPALIREELSEEERRLWQELGIEEEPKERSIALDTWQMVRESALSQGRGTSLDSRQLALLLKNNRISENDLTDEERVLLERKEL